jgi:hypothetical protein
MEQPSQPFGHPPSLPVRSAGPSHPRGVARGPVDGPERPAPGSVTLPSRGLGAGGRGF